MRAAVLISALALSACAVHDGWNPNYSQAKQTPYGEYLRAREKALTTGEAPPRRVPVTLPVEAPTAADITGTTRARATAPAAAAVAAPALPRTTSGPYAGSTPALVQFAFAAQHAPGTAVYRRTGGSSVNAARVCASYPNADQAQLAFLAAGGPERDPRGMDPDGDGFVCRWNPAPWRREQL